MIRRTLLGLIAATALLAAAPSPATAATTYQTTINAPHYGGGLTISQARQSVIAAWGDLRWWQPGYWGWVDSDPNKPWYVPTLYPQPSCTHLEVNHFWNPSLGRWRDALWCYVP